MTTAEPFMVLYGISEDASGEYVTYGLMTGLATSYILSEIINRGE